MIDMTCLAEGVMYPADADKVGINLNEVVVGPTGCGKSFSNAYSRLAHTFNSSVVVPISKKAIKDKFSAMFKARGYEVIDLNFAAPEESEYGYDPLDYVHSSEDAINLATRLVSAGTGNDRKAKLPDPYWEECAASTIAALIILVRLIAEENRKRASFADVIKFYRTLKVYRSDYDGDMKTNLDPIFEKAEEKHPGNQATELWKTFSEVPYKTGSCIYSSVSNALDKIITPGVVQMAATEKAIRFGEVGKRKTAVFITTSPMNKSLQNYINVMYGDMFRELFESAESLDSGRLEVPVHIICDDFACGSKIHDFESYISIFRAAGISVTLLLQSESQLIQMYGDYAATTIINNCDTYVYMGGMDIATCRNISQRADRPINKVMEMPLEQVLVFRRGQKFIQARRYQVLNDPLYKEAMGLAAKEADDLKTA